MKKEEIILAVALVVLLLPSVFADNSPILNNFDQEIVVCEPSPLNLELGAADLDSDNVNVGLSPAGPFFAKVTGFDAPITDLLLFSENLTKADANKIYEKTLYVTDGNYVDTKRIKIMVLESNHPPEIGHLGVVTVDLNSTDLFTMNVQVTDAESGNPDKGGFIFTAKDTPDLLGIKIDNRGSMNYTPYSGHLGIHDIKVCVTDPGVQTFDNKLGFCGNGDTKETSCKSFQLAVTEGNSAPTIVLFNATNTSDKIPSTFPTRFEVYKFDPEGINPDTYWYVDNKLKEIDSGHSKDSFTYSFGCEVWGKHSIRATITDGLKNDSVEWRFDVVKAPCPEGILSREKIGGDSCVEKWGCYEWGLCQHAKESHQSGILDIREYEELKQRCSARGWDDKSCGYQTRTCIDVNDCNTAEQKPLEIIPCQFSLNPTCSDRIQNCHNNQCEFQVDCGGPCDPCPTCSDGFKNQEETGADCGGPCNEQCTIRKELPDENRLFKQSMLIFLLIAIVVAAIQVWHIVRTKKALEKPTTKQLEVTYEN